jgi:hypothetical protein
MYILPIGNRKMPRYAVYFWAVCTIIVTQLAFICGTKSKIKKKNFGRNRL